MQTENVVILSGARTAIGTFGGTLAGVAPSALGAAVIKEAVDRAGLEGGDIGHCVMGQVIHTEARDMYMSRVAAVEAGIPVGSPALTLNRLCGSGLQAIVSAAQMVMLGDCETAVGGGAESMSRAGHLLTSARWGQKMGDTAAHDMLDGALQDPFGGGIMGITAENVAERYGIGRAEQDAFAVESNARAARALDEGRFEEQVVPIEVRKRKDTIQFKVDEHVRRDATVESLGGLRPVFKRDGSVTPGNASGINDGASAIVLMSESAAQRRGAKPIARILSYGHAGVEPEVMGIGPVEAVRTALKRAGIGVEDLDVIESNEAFAVQACAVARDLGFPADKTNPNGGAVALGHPIGATGGILTVKALYELKRIGGRYGLITMCIGGGQGIALVIEAM